MGDTPSIADSTIDWLDFCRRATARVREALAGYGSVEERAVGVGRGEGGDTTLVIDAAAEDAVFAELEALAVPVVAVSEERGEVAIAGGGDTRVVIDPVDGSLNAKRRLPFAAVSIAVASGPGMGDVEVGFVGELEPSRDWWAIRGEGVFLDGERLDPLTPGPLEILGLENAIPGLVADAADAIGRLDAKRVRALGSVAVTLCSVASGGLDAMISLRGVRSVDAAAAQLIVREAGGTVLFPEAGPDAALDLKMRSRVIGARDAAMAERLLATF
ncbi:MAG TPA: inositol monophosphatase family protein [Thermoleophilaceae bacterium]